MWVEALCGGIQHFLPRESQEEATSILLLEGSDLAAFFLTSEEMLTKQSQTLPRHSEKTKPPRGSTWESACFQLSRPTQDGGQDHTLTPPWGALERNSRYKEQVCTGVHRLQLPGYH